MTDEQRRRFYEVFEDILLDNPKGGVVGLEDLMTVSQVQQLASILETRFNQDRIAMVAEFHNTFKTPIKLVAEVPSKDRVELRINLLTEELEELKLALDERNIVETLDALLDLEYVLLGTVLECGLASVFTKGFDEVHRSNMSKVCKDFEEAQRTVKVYEDKGQACYPQLTVDRQYIIRRVADDKILKSVGYSPANLQQFLE